MKKLAVALAMCVIGAAHAELPKEDVLKKRVELSNLAVMDTAIVCTGAYNAGNGWRMSADDAWTLGHCEGLLGLANTLVMATEGFLPKNTRDSKNREWIACATSTLHSLRYDVAKGVSGTPKLFTADRMARVGELMNSMQSQVSALCGAHNG